MLASEALLQGCDPLAPPGQQCGGHGSCQAATRTCTCDPGWSKHSDFVEVEECQLSDVGMYVMWSVNLVEVAWVLYKVTWVILARLDHFFEVRRTQKGYTLSKNKGLIGVLLFFSICMPSHVIMILSKYADPFSRIGFDALPTTLFFTGKLGLYSAGIFLQGPMLSATLKHEPRFKRTVTVNYVANSIIGCCSIIAGGVPFVTLLNYQSDRMKQFDVMWAYYACQALTLFAQALTALLVFNHIKKALRMSKGIVSPEKGEQIIRKVGDLQKQIIKQGFVQSLLLVVMASVPFLMNKHQWFLTFSWLAMPILGKALALQVDLDRIKAKTLLQRLGFSSSVASGHATGTGAGAGGAPGSVSENRTMSPTKMGSMVGGGGSVASIASAATSPTNKNKNRNQVLAVTSQGGGEESTADAASEVGMEAILSPESNMRGRFTQFVREKYASEALLLYDACMDYEKMAPTATQEERDRMARKIISNYVVENAIKAVDMPDGMRKEILAKGKTGGFDTDSLKQLKNMAFSLLRENFYHQFRNSDGGE